MSTATISIEVDAETARAFSNAPPEEQRKLQLLLALRLRELTAGQARPLGAILDDLGAKAAARGLTPEALDALLHGEPDTDGR